jgi:glycosyltransferase involved in cell wall biosynthesis
MAQLGSSGASVGEVSMSDLRSKEDVAVEDGDRSNREFSDLSVVVPVFNEELSIRDTLEELCAAIPHAEVVVVDDGSQDATGKILAELDGIVVVNHERNRGYGAALKSGMRAASRTFVAWFDGDGQHRPEDLMAVARPVISGEKDAAIGARGKGSSQPLEGLLGKSVLKLLAESLSGEDIPDLNSGLQCFPRRLIRRYVHLLPDGFPASTNTTLLLLERGYRVGFVPITTRERLGTSKIRLMADGVSTLKHIVRMVVLFDALKVFSLLGFVLIVPGLIYGFTLALIKGEGFPTLAGTVVVSGLLIVLIGVVVDQVTELRKERFEEPWD